MLILLETDDLSPSTQPLFEEYFDKLKDNHPKLQMTAYVPAMNENNPDENVDERESFMRFYRKRQDWLDFALHGFTHTHPPEFQQSTIKQQYYLKSSLELMSKFLKNVIGFKAPFYRMDTDTIKILIDHGVDYYVQWWHLHPLFALKAPLPKFKIIGTHCSDPKNNNQDNIDLIYRKIDTDLIIAENKGWQYSTIGKMLDPLIP